MLILYDGILIKWIDDIRHLKGLSHELDFKNVHKKLQNVA
jgi:hypothetical protein